MMATMTSSQFDIPQLFQPTHITGYSLSSSATSSTTTSPRSQSPVLDQTIPKIFQKPSRLALHPQNQENYQLARDAQPMAFSPLPSHLIPTSSARILPPVLHYGYAVPLARLTSLAVAQNLIPQSQSHARSQTQSKTPNAFLVARTVREASDYLQAHVFHARVQTAPVVNEDVKFVFSLYTNYTVEERAGRAAVSVVEERIREWLAEEGADGEELEARWFVDADDWHWRWSTASL